jgi:hypothetical protein
MQSNIQQLISNYSSSMSVVIFHFFVGSEYCIYDLRNNQKIEESINLHSNGLCNRGKTVGLGPYVTSVLVFCDKMVC